MISDGQANVTITIMLNCFTQDKLYTFNLILFKTSIETSIYSSQVWYMHVEM